MEGDSRRRTFIVTGLNPQLDEGTLFKKFSVAGPLEYIQLMRDPNTKKCNGNALVKYFRWEDAVKCHVISTTTHDFGPSAKFTWIDDAEIEPMQKFLVTNLSLDINNDGFLALFLKYGDILCCYIETDDNGNSTGRGQVYLKSCNVKNVIKELDNMEVNNMFIAVTNVDPVIDAFEQETFSCSYLFVDNIHKTTSVSEIRDVFGQFKNLKEVEVITQETQKVAFLFYDSAKAVKESVLLMAYAMKIYDAHDITLANYFQEPCKEGQVCAVPIVAQGICTPAPHFSWELAWQVFVKPPSDLFGRKWNIYQVCFKKT